MRIACPSCAAEYEVPDQALAAGPRLLRCARCSHQFAASLPEPEPEPEPAVVAAPIEVMRPVQPAAAPPPPRDRLALAGWLLTLAVLGVALYATWSWRADIMAAWPPSARLLRLLPD